jgi:hypothetical protein
MSVLKVSENIDGSSKGRPNISVNERMRLRGGNKRPRA